MVRCNRKDENIRKRGREWPILIRKQSKLATTIKNQTRILFSFYRKPSHRYHQPPFFAISKKNNSTRTDTHKSFKAKQRFNLNSVSMKKFIHFLELISFQGKLTFAQKSRDGSKTKMFLDKKKNMFGIGCCVKKKQTMIFHFLCDKDEAGFEKEMIFPCSKLDLSSMFGVTGKMDLELFHFLSLSLSLSHTLFCMHAHTCQYILIHTQACSYTLSCTHTHHPNTVLQIRNLVSMLGHA